MRTQYLRAVLLLTACLSAALFVRSESAAQEPAGARRTLFEHRDQSEVPGKTIVTGTAELPPGAEVGWHVHPGDEAGYIVRGEVILKTRGQPDRHLKAGDSFINPRGAVHNMVALPGSTGALAFSTWIVDKDKPLAEKRE